MLYGMIYKEPYQLLQEVRMVIPRSRFVRIFPEVSLITCFTSVREFTLRFKEHVKDKAGSFVIFDAPNKLMEITGLKLDFDADSAKHEYQPIPLKELLKPKPNQDIGVKNLDEINQMVTKALNMPLCTPLYSALLYKFDHVHRNNFKNRLMQYLFQHQDINLLRAQYFKELPIKRGAMEANLNALIGFFESDVGKRFAKCCLILTNEPKDSIRYDQLALEAGIDAYEMRYFQAIRHKSITSGQ